MENEEILNVGGSPVLDEFGPGPSGCPWQRLLCLQAPGPPLVMPSLEGLAEVGEANANARQQHFLPAFELFATRLGFNFKHDLEKALQMP